MDLWLTGVREIAKLKWGGPPSRFLNKTAVFKSVTINTARSINALTHELIVNLRLKNFAIPGCHKSYPYWDYHPVAALASPSL